MHVNIYSRDTKRTTPITIVRSERDSARYVGIRFSLENGDEVTFWERSETNVLGSLLNRASDVAFDDYLERNRGEMDPANPEDR